MMAKKKVYDGKLLFETYCNWGAAASNPRLMEFARQTYGQTSQMGPHYAMWKWAFQNPEEAYEMWKELQFNKNPEDPIPTFEQFLLKIRELAVKNPSIGGSKQSVERFCAKYGLPMDYRVNPDDVIQVTRPDHALFQRLLIVEKVEGDRVEAFIFNPDGTRSNHQLKVREFGVIDRVIV
jgi:hypothetical protein